MLHVAGGPNNSNNVSPEYVCVSRAFKHEPLAALKHNVAALHWKKFFLLLYFFKINN